MVYLLIALVLAVILSPLLSLRQSPRQKLITTLRQCAVQCGLQIKLVQSPLAREGDKQLDTVRYRLCWGLETKPSQLRRAEQWQLVRHSLRGDASPWNGWRWLTLPIAESLQPDLGEVVAALPVDVIAIDSGRDGLSIYWRERGELADVKLIYSLLDRLGKHIRD